jgi:hypothetical protein
MNQERQFGGSEPRRPPRGPRGQGNGNGSGLPFGHRHFMTPTGPARNINGNGNGAGSPLVQHSGKAKGKLNVREPIDSPDARKIQFGKLSMPGDNTPQRPPQPRGSASTTLVNRALRQSFNSPKSPTVNLNSNSNGIGNGNTSSPLASSPKRKKKKGGNGLEEGELEEVTFRKSGAGGGKVEGWGRELDEEERKAKKVNKAAKKREKEDKQVSKADTAAGGGLSIKGRSQAASTPGQKYHGGY